MNYSKKRLDEAVAETTSTLMKDVINLRQVRKAKAREEAEAKADANRAAFGRSKLEKKNTKAKNDAVSRHLDAHKRDKDA